MLKRASVIGTTLLVAYILNLIPLPYIFKWLKPDWVALVVIYWCIALPHRIGIGTGWLVGLLKDAMSGFILGQYALCYSVIAYFSLKLSHRIRVFPLAQQALIVLMLLLISELLAFWVAGIINRAPNSPLYWLSVTTGMAMWPVVYLTLRRVRRKFKLN